MNIACKSFSIMFPRRADISGRPFGFLFVWHLGGPPESYRPGKGKFYPLTGQFGFFLPWFPVPKGEPFECPCLLEKGPFPNDWREWPEIYRQGAEAAIHEMMAQRPGKKLLWTATYCDRRIDLAGQPYQLNAMIEVG